MRRSIGIALVAGLAMLQPAAHAQDYPKAGPVKIVE